VPTFKFSLSECYHYSRYDICAMFNTQRIFTDVLNGCYASYTRNSDTLDTKLLIRLLIKLDTIVIIYKYIMAQGSVVIRVTRNKAEGRGSRLDEVNKFFLIFLILAAALVSGVYSSSNRN
jgi:hypothetical protein